MQRSKTEIINNMMNVLEIVAHNTEWACNVLASFDQMNLSPQLIITCNLMSFIQPYTEINSELGRAAIDLKHSWFRIMITEPIRLQEPIWIPNEINEDSDNDDDDDISSVSDASSGYHSDSSISSVLRSSESSEEFSDLNDSGYDVIT